MKTLTHSQHTKFHKRDGQHDVYRSRDRREGKRSERRLDRARAIREAMKD